ncbi:C40 family peptidase [Lunatimonas salinarum]|uniref:C40 family peptidase n=1 Tax=Lunatimonas salinarum TaxID=1774590 RepID=UPI001AE074FE|nr:C40 family peptidase [Lunatimonas salinarum]
MKKTTYLFLFALSTIWFSCSDPNKEAKVAEIISTVKATHAPDKRIALWEITFENGLLKGETNLPDALKELVGQMEANGIPYQNQVNILPDKELGDKTLALVTISVANIRSQPKHSAELATQALLGTPLNVLKQEGSWYLVQTPEGYISWVDAAGIALKSTEEMAAWTEAEKLVYTEMLGVLFSKPDLTQLPVSDLTAGNMLKHLGEEGNFYLVELPDGRKGYVSQDETLPYVSWLASRELSDENLIATAKRMMGVPYLWGGTSPKGVDCSGFTKTVFFLNGMIIPRDASQQVNEGQEVDTTKNWENLEVGDLLFFGVPAAEDKPERVVHVGMWIGDQSFIHSRGRVRISSFDPNDENYDEYELNRYLRTKRIRHSTGDKLWKVNSLIH